MPFNQDLQDRGNDAADKIERGYIVILGIGLCAFLALILALAIINSGGGLR